MKNLHVIFAHGYGVRLGFVTNIEQYKKKKHCGKKVLGAPEALCHVLIWCDTCC